MKRYEETRDSYFDNHHRSVQLARDVGEYINSRTSTYQLEELEASAAEDELAAEQAAARSRTVQSFQRKRPSREPFPDHLPRERIVIAAPESCPCCGSSRLSKLGEEITETMEVVPRQWKVILTVREKFSCRTCETINQPPAPFHVTPRAGHRRLTNSPPSSTMPAHAPCAVDGRKEIRSSRAAPSKCGRTSVDSAECCSHIEASAKMKLNRRHWRADVDRWSINRRSAETSSTTNVVI